MRLYLLSQVFTSSLGELINSDTNRTVTQQKLSQQKIACELRVIPSVWPLHSNRVFVVDDEDRAAAINFMKKAF